jgi:hypothetical protein
VEYTAHGTPKKRDCRSSICNTIRASTGNQEYSRSTKDKRNYVCAQAADTATKVDVIMTDDKSKKCLYKLFFNKQSNYAKNLQQFGDICVTKDHAQAICGKVTDRGDVCMLI